MTTAITALNVALLVVLIVFVVRAAQLHQQARRLRYQALTAQNRASWCHAMIMHGWCPWNELPPSPGSLVDVLHYGETVPKIMRAPEDHVPALMPAFWRPYQPRETVSRLGRSR